MRSNVKKLMLRRVLIVALAILLQLTVFVVTMFLLSDYRSWIQTALTILSAVSVLYILYDSSNSSYKISWIILILAFPVAGICIYMAFGGRRLSRRIRERMTLAEDIVRENLRQEPLTFETLQNVSDPGAAISSYLYHTTGYPAYDNTETEYFSSGEDTFRRMLEELKKAEKYIFLEYFIIGEGVMWDAIFEILKEKSLRGVDVRVMYDDFGCITTLPADYVMHLGGYGIRAKIFNPIVPVLSGRLNNRSHRKLLIVDGKVGFTGGINLADEYINEKERFGHWKDCGLCLRGEAVWAMTVMFLSMWDSQTGEKEDVSAYRPEYAYPLAGGEGFVQPYADTPLDAEDVSENLLVSLFHRAVRSIYIMTPYLILDDKITSALLCAARSGVDVRIVTPHVPDKWYVHAVTRAHYEMLTEAGIRVYEYSPGFIHSKVYLVDDRYAVAGTVNLDFRSLYLHFENAVFLYEPACILSIGDDFRRTFPVCEEITWRKCKNTGLFQRLVRAVLRIFAPLM
ncbi:MAG: cardiolipin synthase [Oscillospiraceae bacterium]|nr:cardiolipin synthase [Oscillospiraceae bacterium]